MRDVQDADIPIFFEFLQSSRQQWQAAFIPEEPSNFDNHLEHWQKILSDPTVLNKTILLADQVVGHVGRWMLDGIGQVTFWIGEEFEGKHIASTALARYLEIDSLRPLQGRCAFDNLA
ncbi:MAG: GNAT family N-acetyltransferase, partial [Actinobacteria bacterium]|nr:GNAT family N-acetyltransferase [Actinomycetota bacterium]